MSKTSPGDSSAPFGSSGRAWWAGLGLALLVVAAYASVFHAGWLWDDDSHVTANPTIIGPLGLKEIWTTSAANYFPLVLTNFWVQHAAWEVDPLGYHLVTLFFHVACAVLLWRILLRLEVTGAWLGAALWALHPVQVESVAWICELKNTQSGWFFLLAIYFFTRWLNGSRNGGQSRAWRGAYALSLVCAILALLSKPSTVMLPPVLGLVAWWKHGRLGGREAKSLVPFFLLSAIVAGWTIWEQKVHSGATGESWNQGLVERCLIAGRVPWFYLGKLLWPHPLVFIYPRWAIEARAWTDWLPLVLTLTTLGFLWWKRQHPVVHRLLVGGLYFGIMLFPVLGFFSVYFFRYSFVGDHFQYLASMGPLVLAGSALASGANRLGPSFRAAGISVAAGFVGLLAFLSWQHAQGFLTYETLWRATLARNPTCVMAWVNLAGDYAKAHRYGEAVTAFQEAARLDPRAPDVYNDMGGSLFLLKRAEEAKAAYEEALRLKPGYADAHNGLGNALHALGRREEARIHYAEALRLDPAMGQAHNNLGTDLAETQEYEGAIAHFQAALELLPGDIFARDNLRRVYQQQGQALAARGRVDEAIAVFERAVQMDPGFPAALGNLGTTLALANRWPRAAEVFQQVVEQAPADPVMRQQLAIALVNADKLELAVPQFEEALRLNPRSAELHQQLSQVFGVLGQSDQAQAHRAEAARLGTRPPSPGP